MTSPDRTQPAKNVQPRAALSSAGSAVTDEEIAALVAVLVNLQTPATRTGGSSSEWPATNRVRNAHLVRRESWRASALPR